MGTFPAPLPHHMTSAYEPPWPDWNGATCLILGGGPSLADMDWEEIRTWRTNHPNRRIIAVNEACLSIVTDADIAYWVDGRWFQWNKERLAKTNPRQKWTSAHGDSVKQGGAHYISNKNMKDFHIHRKLVAGLDSGGIAINIAYHCNASTAYLLGFDMHDTPAKAQGTGNFHDKHPVKQPGLPRSNHFIPKHGKMRKAIADLDLDFAVFNCTPDSALKCWPYVPWSRIR